MKSSKRGITRFIIVTLFSILFFHPHGITGVYVATGSFSYLVETRNNVKWYRVGAAASPSVRDLQNTPIDFYSGWGSVSVTANGKTFSDSGSMWARVYAHRYADGTVVHKFTPGPDRSASAFVKLGDSYTTRASGHFY